MYEDKKGRLWIGTPIGVMQYDRERDVIFPVNSPWSDEMKGYKVFAFHEDKFSRIWVATLNGLFIIDNDLIKYKHFLPDSRSNNNLNSKFIMTIYEDRGGIIWLGTVNGLNGFDSNKSNFNYYYPANLTKNKDNSNLVLSVYEDSEGILWAGIYNEGLIKFKRNGQTISQYKADRNSNNTISNNSVLTIAGDNRGSLWLGTLGGGFNKFNIKTEKFISYVNDPDNTNSISDNFVSQIYLVNDEVILISTSKGLNEFNTKTEKFTRYLNSPENHKSISHNFPLSIFIDSKRRCWIGTYGGGLNHFFRNKKEFVQYKNIPGESKSISTNFIYKIHEDMGGIFWIGSNSGGLIRFDPEIIKFKNYLKNDGLPNNTVWDILDDKKGNLWLSTLNGISKFNIRNEVFTNFSSNDGFYLNFFEPNNAFRSESGEMFFWGDKGIVTFFPEKIMKNKYTPPIVITSIKKNRNGNIIKIPVLKNNEIIFSYKDNLISFDFAALSFSNPGKNQFKYKLAGLDENWINLETKHSISFSNLDPGKYSFKVKGSNCDGVWNENGAEIKFRIIPPLWLTWWFKIFSSIFILSLFIYFHLTRMKRLKLRLESKAAMEKFFDKSNISEREREIIILILKGKTSREIEDELFIAYGTVKNHITSIYKKLDVKNRVEIVNIFKKLDFFK